MATLALQPTSSPLYINQAFDLEFVFTNTGGQIYFLPAIEVYLPPQVDIPSLPILATWDGNQWLDPQFNPIINYPNYPDIPLLPGINPGDTYRNFLLGYSSYGPTQPPLEFLKSTIVTDINYVLGNTYDIRSRGLFLLGQSPVYDPISSPPIIGSTITLTLSPVPYAIIKRISGLAGNAQPTGPSYPTTYTLEVHLAPDQSISETIIQDTIDPNLRYIANSVVNSVPLTLVSTPPTPGEYSVPLYNGTLVWNLGARTGAPVTGSTYTFQYQVYTSYYQYSTDTQVLDSSTPANSTTATNTATLSDGVNHLIDSNTVNLAVSPISISKNASGPFEFNLAGLYLNYILTISVSNYFAFRDISVLDLMSAGQIFIPPGDPSGNVPTISIPGMSTVNMTPSQVTTTAVAPYDPVPPYFPTTQVVFTTPDMLYQGTIYAQQASSGSIPNDESILGDDLGKYQVIISYFCRLDNQYTPTPPLLPTPFTNLGAYDLVQNTAQLSATNVDIATGSPTNTVQETISQEFEYPIISVNKTFYAYNGVVGDAPAAVLPGDVVTYRLVVELPNQNFVNMVITDYLPPPIINAAGFTGATFPSNVGDPTPPAAWNVSFGPGLNVVTNGPSYLPPGLSVNVAANSISFDFGSYEDPAPNYAQTIDILLSASITFQPFQPGIVFTNQGVVRLENALGDFFTITDVQSLVLGEPDLYVKKSVIDSDEPNADIGNRLALVNMYGSVFSTGLGPGFVPIDNTYFNSFVGSAVSGVSGGDYIRFLILLDNSGSSVAYDVQVIDFLTQGLIYQPAVELAFDQNGNPVPFSSSVSSVPGGTQIVYSFTDPIPAGGLIIILYTASIDPDVVLCTPLYNTATISAWTNIAGGDNFVTTLGLLREATSDVYLQALLGSNNYLGTNSGVTSGNDVILGDVANFEIIWIYPRLTDGSVVVGVSISYGLVFTAGTVVTDPGFSSSNDPPIVTITPNTIRWDFGDVRSDSDYTQISLPFSALIPASNPNLVNGRTLTFVFSYDSISPCYYLTTYNLTVVEPNLSITKTLNPLTADLDVYYNITLFNSGTSPAFDVTIVDDKPSEFGAGGFVIVSSPAYTDNSTATQLNITLDNPINPGVTVVITIRNTLQEGLPHGTLVTNTATQTSKSLNIDDGTERVYTGSSTITFSINPVLIVNVSDITYDHNLDYGGSRTGVVGAVGDRMNYKVQWFVPVGTEELISLTMQFPNFLGLVPELPSGAVIQTFPNTYDGTVLTMSVTYDDTGLVTFNINTVYVNTSDSDVSFIWNYWFRIANDTMNTAGVYYNPQVSAQIKNQQGETVVILPDVPPSITDFNVVEPNIYLIKTGPTLPVLPGGTLNYVLNITNPKNPWTSSAFQLITDDMSFNLPNIFGSASITSPTPIPNMPLELRNITEKLIPGNVLTLNVTGTLLPGVPSSTFYYNNIASSMCRSVSIDLPDTSYSRTGIEGVGALDGYYATDSSDLNIIPVAISKTRIGSGPVTLGQSVQYQIRVTMPLGTFTQVVLTDNFSNLTYSSFSLDSSDFMGLIVPPVIAVISGSLTATFSSITATGPDTNFILNLFYTVSGNVGQDISNSVILSGQGISGSAATGLDRIVGPDLYLTKTRITQEVIVGQPIQYLIVVGHTSQSTADAYDLVVTDIPSQGVQSTMNVSFVPPPDLPYTLDPVSVPLLPLGVGLEIRYTVSLPVSPVLSGTNTATGVYRVSLNNQTTKTMTDTDSYQIEPGQLSLAKTASCSTVNFNEVVVWYLNYANTGNAPLEGVVLTEDVFPAWVLPILTTPSSPGWAGTGQGPYTLDLGTLQPGQSGVALFTTQILDTVPTGTTSFTNTSSIIATDTPQLNAQATVFIVPYIIPNTALSISKIVMGGVLSPGGYISYNIIVTNTGNVDYNGNVTVSDIIPAGTSWDGLGGWSQVGYTLQQTALASLTPGAELVFPVTFNISASNNYSQITNVASLVAEGGIYGNVSVVTPLSRPIPPPPPPPPYPPYPPYCVPYCCP